MPAPGMSGAEVNLRAILRIVLVIVGVVLTLYVIYLLRKPIGWIVLATFIAVAMSAPVNLLARHMHRGPGHRALPTSACWPSRCCWR